ncbi:TMEM43 family protein [bacterium]|nr:TMEM43 family protein [bacterium]
MRVLRGVVFILGLILIIVGISQPLLPKFWIRVSRGIVESESQIRVFGAVAVFFGAILLISAIKRAVAFIPYVAALGLVAFAFGIVMLINPGAMTELMGTIFSNRSEAMQYQILWIAGIIRVVFGALLLLAVTRARSLPEQ